MEEISELKRNMLRVIINREEMPEEVIEVIENAFVEMKNMYEELKCDYPSTRQYIEGKKEEVIYYVNKYIENTRKDDQINEIQYILEKMKRDLEEPKQDEDKIREENMYREGFLSVQGKNENYTKGIMDILKDELRNIQSRQNYILDANGKDYYEIEQIDEEISYFIRTFENQNDQKIFDALQNDDKQLQQTLLSQYEDYLEQNKKTDKQKFKEGLASNISLEEQNEFAKEIAKKQENREQDENTKYLTLEEDVIQ